MPLHRDESGIWSGSVTADDGLGIDQSPTSFIEGTLEFLNAFDGVFQRARDRCELEFLFSLFRVRRVCDAGWDPFETTMEAIPSIEKLHRSAQDSVASGHLELWTYGHILEAAEPYEILFNLLHVGSGGHYCWGTNFPLKKGGAPPSPGEKIRKIQQLAETTGHSSNVAALTGIWDRHLRNAVFHSDYVLFGPELRILQPPKKYAFQEIMKLVNRALGYLAAIWVLNTYHIRSYEAPKVIPTSPHFKGDRSLRWIVIVRDGYGAAGVKDAWSGEELRSGKIPLRIGRFSEGETKLLNGDSTLALLPVHTHR